MAKILIIGGGGREHALAWKLKQSPKVEKIYIAPGNGGMSNVGEIVDIKTSEFDKLTAFAKEKSIDFTVIGPDDPLGAGIVDAFKKEGLRVWGPVKAAARIEASKAFAKDIMAKENIPTAEFRSFDNYEEALKYLREKGAPIVIKASGLAQGKGVTVCQTLEEAEVALKDAMVNKIFGEAGNTVVIEECIYGPEYSIHAFTDGKTFKMFPSSQDHKPVFDGGKGPNTGGMGTIAPVPWVTSEVMDEVSKKVVGPVLKGLEKAGALFVGLIYPGMMETQNGSKVIEFNCRFGDPETQSYIRLLKSDLYEILDASVDGRLDEVEIEWHPGFACCVALASGGYPGSYEKGKEITGIEEAEKMDDIIVFHAGTKLENGKIVTNGGRVLGVTAKADTLRGALDKAYAAIKLINFDGMHYRTDIGLESLNMKV
ncbi:MAG: phosphoribosylamine--glycine ligase [Patescibacteria group bacterium]|jgi:phosphoribosylamine--glycine ligase